SHSQTSSDLIFLANERQAAARDYCINPLSGPLDVALKLGLSSCLSLVGNMLQAPVNSDCNNSLGLNEPDASSQFDERVVIPLLSVISVLGVFSNMILILVFIRAALVRRKNFSLDGILSAFIQRKSWPPSLYRKPTLVSSLSYRIGDSFEGTFHSFSPPPTPDSRMQYEPYTCTNLILVPPHIRVNPTMIFDTPVRGLRRVDTTKSLHKKQLFARKPKHLEENFRFNKEITHFFTMSQAIADLLVCALVVPSSAFFVTPESRTVNIIYYKLYMFLNLSLVMYSSLTTIAIAFERFISIIHPFKRIITTRIAKIGSLSIATFCLIISLFSALSLNFIRNGLCDITESKMNSVMIKMCTVLFVLCMLSVLILYGRIWVLVIKLRKNGRKLDIDAMLKRRPKVHPLKDEQVHPLRKKFYRRFLVPNHCNLEPKSPRMSNGFKHKSEQQLPTTREQTSQLLKNSQKRLTTSLPQIKDRYKHNNHLIQNLRTALVLFTSAIVYIITFTPALLVWNNALEKSAILTNLYFINNASNPIVYLILSKNLRSQLLHLFVHGNKQILAKPSIKLNASALRRKSKTGTCSNPDDFLSNSFAVDQTNGLLEVIEPRLSVIASCPNIPYELEGADAAKNVTTVQFCINESTLPTRNDTRDSLFKNGDR
ncbi:hypothetical protein Ciccas_007777, partial [Cichlidogyrus casuarinus]